MKILAAFVIVLALSGCASRKRTASLPPPPLPAPVQPAPPEPMPPPWVDPKPEELTAIEGPAPPAALPPPPKPAARPRRPVRTATPAPSNPPAAAPAPAPAPQLGEVLTPERRATLAAQFSTWSAQARQDLGRIAGRALSTAQNQSAERVRAFLAQADGLIEADPRSAAELARRAALLARDLANSIR